MSQFCTSAIFPFRSIQYAKSPFSDLNSNDDDEYSHHAICGKWQPTYSMFIFAKLIVSCFEVIINKKYLYYCKNDGGPNHLKVK